MWRILLIAGGVLVLAAIAVPVAIYFSSDVKVRRFVPTLAGAQTPVTDTIDLPLAAARARIVAVLGVEFEGPRGYSEQKHPEYGPQFASYTALSNSNGAIDGQFRVVPGGLSSDAPISTSELNLPTQDPGLPAYLQLPIEARAQDLQIHCDGAWTAPDMQKNGRLLPYSSRYILHLEAASPDTTKITVLGLYAQVVDGQRWSVLGDMFVSAPRQVPNVLYAPPSPLDKRDFLNRLLTQVRADRAKPTPR